MPIPGTRLWLRRGLVVVVVLLVAVGGATAYVLLHAPGNVSHPKVEFTTPASGQPPKPPAKPKVVVDTFMWPRYGFDAARTRLLPNSRGLDPPFRRGWTYRGTALLEFPPVIHGTSMYVIDDVGVVIALDKLTGRQLWKTRVGTLAAASPAIGAGLVFVPVLSTHPNAGQNPGAGRFVALAQKTGKVVWSRDVPSGTESSPLVWDQTVYFGDQDGTVRALRTRDGHEWWSYHASGAVKGGPSLSGGIVYFGDYAGRAYALRAGDGHEVWAVSTSGTRLGFGSGNFYSSPAIAFGRVYMGNTDGRVYSFAAHTGQLAWATSTGAYVYSSPAVSDTPGLGPTVYIGSYDGAFYAFDARSGSVRWRHAAGGRISGSPTIVGDVVYYANLGDKTTSGLDVRTGREVFSFPEGSFNPVIADGQAVYLTGYANLFQMLPSRPHAAAAGKPSPNAANHAAAPGKTH
jgi:outer membrane protein assembly factor BamB